MRIGPRHSVRPRPGCGHELDQEQSGRPGAFSRSPTRERTVRAARTARGVSLFALAAFARRHGATVPAGIDSCPSQWAVLEDGSRPWPAVHATWLAGVPGSTKRFAK